MSQPLGPLGIEKNKPAIDNPVVCLVELQIPGSPPTRIRLTNNTEDVVDGINHLTGELLIYRHHPFVCEGIGKNKSADLETLTLRIEKPRPILVEEIVENDWLLDQPFVLTWMPASPPFAPSARDTFEGFVIETEIDAGDVVFRIGNPGLASAPFPTRRYSGIYCGVDKFGDEECGYRIPASPTNVIGGGFDSCGYHLTDCDIRGQDEAARAVEVLHPRNFKCMPGILRGNT